MDKTELETVKAELSESQKMVKDLQKMVKRKGEQIAALSLLHNVLARKMKRLRRRLLLIVGVMIRVKLRL